MKIIFFFRNQDKKNTIDKYTFTMRLWDSKTYDERIITDISVHPGLWDRTKQRVKQLAMFTADEKEYCERQTRQLSDFITQKYMKDKLVGTIRKGWLKDAYNLYKQQQARIVNLSYTALDDNESFESRFLEFMKLHEVSSKRMDRYMVLCRLVKRFCAYVQHTSDPNFKFAPKQVTTETLAEFDYYLYNEHEIVQKHAYILDVVPEQKKLKPRGRNTIVIYHKMLRCFFKWCRDNGIVTQSPYTGYKIKEEIYGTPLYLTLDELQQLYKLDLSKERRPALELHRDIFVFQSCVGCRVSDLYRAKYIDVVDDVFSYIPRKTINNNPLTVSVPLNDTAKAILEKYKKPDSKPTDPLFPFKSQQHYNNDLKEIFRLAKLVRPVQVINPLTLEAEKVTLDTLASSHMARRNFVGNIYRQVKDQALVASLSGHKPNSSAFARYRDIDISMKQDMVEILGLDNKK